MKTSSVTSAQGKRGSRRYVCFSSLFMQLRCSFIFHLQIIIEGGFRGIQPLLKDVFVNFSFQLILSFGSV